MYVSYHFKNKNILLDFVSTVAFNHEGSCSMKSPCRGYKILVDITKIQEDTRKVVLKAECVSGYYKTLHSCIVVGDNDNCEVVSVDENWIYLIND